MNRNMVLGLAVATCLTILFLPTICDDTLIPGFLTLAVHHKVIAAYVLGKYKQMYTL